MYCNTWFVTLTFQIINVKIFKVRGGVIIE